MLRFTVSPTRVLIMTALLISLAIGTPGVMPPEAKGGSFGVFLAEQALVTVGGFSDATPPVASKKIYAWDLPRHKDSNPTSHWSATGKELPYPIAGTDFASSIEGVGLFVCYSGAANVDLAKAGENCKCLTRSSAREPTAEDSWCGAMSQPRYDAGTAAARGSIFVAGGKDIATNALLNTIEVFVYSISDGFKCSAAMKGRLLTVAKVTNMFPPLTVTITDDDSMLYLSLLDTQSASFADAPTVRGRGIVDRVNGVAQIAGNPPNASVGNATKEEKKEHGAIPLPPKKTGGDIPRTRGHAQPMDGSQAGDSSTVYTSVYTVDIVNGKAASVKGRHAVYTGLVEASLDPVGSGDKFGDSVIGNYNLPAGGTQRIVAGPASLDSVGFGTVPNIGSMTSTGQSVAMPGDVGDFTLLSFDLLSAPVVATHAFWTAIVRQDNLRYTRSVKRHKTVEVELTIPEVYDHEGVEVRFFETIDCSGRAISDPTKAHSRAKGVSTFLVALNELTPTSYLCLNLGACEVATERCPAKDTDTNADSCVQAGCCWRGTGATNCLKRNVTGVPSQTFWILQSTFSFEVVKPTRTDTMSSQLTQSISITPAPTASGNSTPTTEPSSSGTVSPSQSTSASSPRSRSESTSPSPSSSGVVTPSATLAASRSPNVSQSLSLSRSTSTSASISGGSPTPSSTASTSVAPSSSHSFSAQGTASNYTFTPSLSNTSNFTRPPSPPPGPASMTGIITAAAGLVGLLVVFGVVGLIYYRRKSAVRPDPVDTTPGGINQYRMVGKLGSGGYGVVYHIERKKDKKRFAMKYISCQTNKDRLIAIQEFEMLRKLQGHPNIIPLYDMFMNWEEDPDSPTRTQRTGGFGEASPLLQSEEQMQTINDNDHRSAVLALTGNARYVCIIMQYFPEGDLCRYIQTYHQSYLIPESIILRVCSQVAYLLYFLHTQNPPIIHRDIKPENILMDQEKDRVVVTDFGLAVMNMESMREKAGTALYMAPEMFAGKPSPKSDVWGLGCIIYGMCTRRIDPSQTRPMFTDAKKAGFADEVKAEMRHYSPELVQLTLDMLKPKPDDRPTAHMVINRCYDIKPRVMEDTSFFNPEASSPERGVRGADDIDEVPSSIQ